MTSTIEKHGFAAIEELRATPGFPSDERLAKGPCAVIECVQEIPCNPCEAACPRNSIKVGVPITNLPILDEDRCTGCGICIASCPGLAIFVVDMSQKNGKASVQFPWEYLPMPVTGSTVELVNREGVPVTTGTVKDVRTAKAYDRTTVVTVEVPREKALEVRGIARRPK
ncbi:MAG: 4Fe-4S binding protein [Firmicutes bacterium]|nr:4Fe-4S binding protein [Bacillota bacterium]